MSLKDQEFDSSADAKSFIENFNRTNFTNFVVNSSNARQLVFKCKHGVERKSSCGGVRPKQHYNFMNCAAIIRLYKRNNGKFKVTHCELTHNHPTTAAIHKFNNAVLNEEDKDLVLTLKEANAKPSQIKRVLCNRADYKMSTQKVKNIISKLITDDSSGKELEEFMSEMHEEGGTIKFTYDSDGTVESLFLSSAKMKRKFIDINPFSVQLDTTFNVEEGRYKLVAFCYLDVPCNKTEVAAIAFIAGEGEANFNFIFIEFKALNDRNDYIFLVDKDFTSISCLQRNFTEATILLCRFHVFKFMKTLIATALTTVEIKDQIYSKFRELTYTPSESLYDDRRREFLDTIKDVQIRVNKVYVGFTDYFIKNWDTCTSMWVKYHRNDLPLFGDHTTNRIERQFEALKQTIADSFNTVPKTSQAIMHLIGYINDRLDERNVLTSSKRLVIFDSDSDIHSLNKEASKYLNEKGCVSFHKSLKLMSERKKNLFASEHGVTEMFKDGESKLYQVTDRSCICTYYKENLAPCHHMLYHRHVNQSPMFDAEAFDRRYHHATVPDVNADPNVQNNPDVDSDLQADENDDIGFDSIQDVAQNEEVSLALTDREKFKLIFPIMTSISNLVSLHSTNQFYSYMEEFKNVEKLVRRGKSVFDNGINVQAQKDAQEPDNTTISQSLVAESSNTTSTTNAQENPSEQLTTITESHTIATSSSTISTAALTQEKQILELNQNPIAQPASKFSMKFKEKLKTKGRPKKASKQVVFNKSTVDKENTTSGRKKGKKPQNKRRKTADVIADMLADKDDESEMDLGAELLSYDGIVLPSNDGSGVAQISRGTTDNTYGAASESIEDPRSISTSPVYSARSYSGTNAFHRYPAPTSGYSPYPKPQSLGIRIPLNSYAQTNDFIAPTSNDFTLQSSYVQQIPRYPSGYAPNMPPNSQWTPHDGFSQSFQMTHGVSHK